MDGRITVNNEKYLIQQLTRRLFESVPDIPEKDVVWDKLYVGQLAENEFYNGICAFINVIKNILKDIQSSPQDWDMPCIEIVNLTCGAPRTSDETKVSNKLWDVGDLLLTFGAEGVINNHILYINNTEFLKK